MIFKVITQFKEKCIIIYVCMNYICVCVCKYYINFMGLKDINYYKE